MTPWNVGDLVIFNEVKSRWNGGKGEVVGRNHKSEMFTVKVRMLELPPELNESPHLVGCVTNHMPTDLLPYKAPSDAVAHPSHYGGGDNPYEVIKVAEAWGFDQDAYLFNVLKYIARAGKKGATLEDHKKARFYLDRKISRLESAECP